MTFHVDLFSLISSEKWKINGNSIFCPLSIVIPTYGLEGGLQRRETQTIVFPFHPLSCRLSVAQHCLSLFLLISLVCLIRLESLCWPLLVERKADTCSRPLRNTNPKVSQVDSLKRQRERETLISVTLLFLEFCKEEVVVPHERWKGKTKMIEMRNGNTLRDEHIWGREDLSLQSLKRRQTDMRHSLFLSKNNNKFLPNWLSLS